MTEKQKEKKKKAFANKKNQSLGSRTTKRFWGYNKY